ncbi:hypothetical protein E2C01_002870 [Portunus trituberculatus]|uniref:Uncharacterized protein n=1 Tax=Portunus trituberculatus TaxID=210409 RepID=A0A5B7CMD5_PORTR|nr:hypothetical protein [Portunus trituberculatus]
MGKTYNWARKTIDIDHESKQHSLTFNTKHIRIVIRMSQNTTTPTTTTITTSHYYHTTCTTTTTPATTPATATQ